MEPSIGRIVIYKTTLHERTVNDFDDKELPGIVVQVKNATVVNLRVQTNSLTVPFLATTVAQGNNEGEWSWPVIIK